METSAVMVIEAGGFKGETTELHLTMLNMSALGLTPQLDAEPN